MSNTKNEEKNDSIPIEALIAFSAFPVVVACAVWFVCYFRRNNAPWKNPSKLNRSNFLYAFPFSSAGIFQLDAVTGQ